MIKNRGEIFMHESDAILPETRHAAVTLGDYIRLRREAKRIGMDEMARELKIASRYAAALEEGAYHIFPAKIYAHGFLKRTLMFLGVTEEHEHQACTELFEEEWLKHFPAKHEDQVMFPEQKMRPWLLTPARLIQLAGGIAVLAFFVFLGLQLTHFTGAPRLALTEPSDQFIVDRPLVQIRGTTEKESQLTVNGREVTIDGAGTFNAQIDLQPGVTTLEFLVRNRFGKITKVTRSGVVR